MARSDPPAELGSAHANADLGAAHAAASGAVSIIVLLLFVAVLVFAAMIHRMLGAVAEVMGQVVRMFGLLLLALVVIVLVLAGMLNA